MAMQWEGKFGPASVLALAQLLLIGGGGFVFVTRMQDSIEASKTAVAEIKSAVTTLQNGSVTNSERIAKVETLVGVALNGIDRVEKKLDARPSHGGP